MISIPRLSTTFSCFFALAALSACGGGGNGDNRQMPPPDTTPPALSAVSVPAGSTLNRVVTLSVTVSDTSGVAAVRFFADDTELGSATSSPYTFDWDTSTVADGDHVLHAEADDAAGNTATSADTIVTVRNVVQVAVELRGAEEVPPVDSAGSAQADFTVNLISGAVSGSLVVNGITPTAAHIHDGYAGTNGDILIGLDQDPMDAGMFMVPAGAMLDAAGVERLLAGALYVNAHTAAEPGGELRGQILTDDLVLRLASLEDIATVPRVDSIATGAAAITLNTATGALIVQARVTGLDDATQAHVHEAYAGAAGPVITPLSQDAMDPGRWFVESGSLNAAGLDAFAAGRLYVNVHSPANPDGELRGQILPAAIDVLFAELEGDQEVPAVDTRAAGLAAVTLDAAASIVTLHVNTSRIDDAIASHLHSAYAGVNGPIEIALVQDGGDPGHWFAEEQALTAGQLDALLTGATYINVHSPAHQGGEIRAQLIPDGILFASGRLEGSQEVPAVASGAGGTFAVTVDPAAQTLVAHANTTGADDATAAHLHDAYAGLSGDITIGLTQDAVEISRWSADGVAIDADQLAAFRAGRLYVNVHTPANPGGEIRGQAAPPPVEVLFTPVTGDEEVPAVASAASAVAASTVDRDSGLVTLHLRATGADDATASHIHTGYAGQIGDATISLTQDAGDAGHWSVTEAQLDTDGLAAYLAGRTYVNLHTPANPGGEIRGQIAPQDIQVVLSDLTGDQVVPPVATAASGVAATTTDLRTRRFVAFINSVGADDATSAGIHLGDAGANGAEILALQQTMGNVAQWSGMTEALAAANFSAYRAGRLYAQVATPAQPNGELRGQIVPPDAGLFDDQAPSVTLMSPGATVSDTVTLNADATDNQGVVVVRFLADGVLIGSDSTAPFSTDWDTTMFTNGQVTLTAEAEDEAGNVGESADVVVTIDNAVAVTLTQIQNQVFGPRCSVCHSGPTSNTLPSGMNLSSTATSFAALVGVPSLQVALDRVEPGDPDNSYLIRKLEGGPAIVGTRMPQGGPFLSQETIDMIRQWITDGAPNN